MLVATFGLVKVFTPENSCAAVVTIPFAEEPAAGSLNSEIVPEDTLLPLRVVKLAPLPAKVVAVTVPVNVGAEILDFESIAAPRSVW